MRPKSQYFQVCLVTTYTHSAMYQLCNTQWRQTTKRLKARRSRGLYVYCTFHTVLCAFWYKTDYSEWVLIQPIRGQSEQIYKGHLTTFTNLSKWIYSYLKKGVIEVILGRVRSLYKDSEIHQSVWNHSWTERLSSNQAYFLNSTEMSKHSMLDR